MTFLAYNSRYVAPLLLTIAFALVSCGSNQWIEFTPPDRTFVVSMPARPAQKEVPQNTPLMSIKSIELNHYAITTNEITFAVSFTDYPAAMIAGSTPDKMLDSGIERMFASNPTARKESVKTVLRGFPARSFSIDNPVTGYTAVGRCCLVGQRIYVIQVIRPSRISAKQEIDRFMESFRIGKKIN